MDIGNQVRKRRTELHMTQDELASRLDVVRTTISNWELGRSYPDLQMIVKISNVLDISLDQLLKGDEELVQQISEDTVVRKRQGRNIRRMTIVIIALVAAVVVLALILYMKWAHSYVGYVSDPEQISAMFIDDDNTLHVELNLPDSIGVGGYMTGDGEEYGIANTVYVQIALERDTGVVNPQAYYIPICTDGGGQDCFSKEYIADHDIQRVSVVDEEGNEVYGINLSSN